MGEAHPPYFGVRGGNFFQILHANLYILLLFGIVCLGRQCQAKILERDKDTPLAPVFLLGDIAPSIPGIDAGSDVGQ